MKTSLQKYEEYLLNNKSGERIIEVVTLSHSSFDDSFNLVKEPSGVTVTFEDGSVVECEGVNMDIKRSSSGDDLDEKFGFSFSDENGRIQEQANKIPLDSDEVIVVEYRLYIASDLTAPAIGPNRLEGVTVSYELGRATIHAEQPSLTSSRTGDIYTYERFPMLKAFQ